MPGDKVFLDTNILVYAYDTSAGEKHGLAKEIVSRLWTTATGVISTQVLQEFFVSVTKKVPKPLEVTLAKKIVRDFLKWEVVINDGESVLDAIDIHKKYHYSFWDSLIVEAALKGRCDVIYSEDFSHGQIVEGVTIENPFAGKNTLRK
jgi:predicted nucleic acid-binding protein